MISNDFDPRGVLTDAPTEPDPVDRFRRLEQIYLRASELGGQDRDDYLRRACGSDQELQQQVERLLGFQTSAEARLDQAVTRVSEGLGELPKRIGPYRILGVLGQGGLGVVLLADRDDEHFSKRVALKLARPEVWSTELEQRLRQERQILATFDHPNIARILDGGTTDDGSAYIVMELVEDGLSLVDYCRERLSSVSEKLRLFQQVCDAVQHAHQSLVLHCDLKPSNIMIDGNGVPKLLDFGIAKALQESAIDRIGDSQPLTLEGRRPLTPDYASPEQILYQPLTTRSDIYSLGVILFELLCGERPYRLNGLNPLEVAERVTKTVPPPAGSRFRSSSRDRKRVAPWGKDLDAIVAKALHKEPSRRYGSVEQLSEDIGRYLEHRPVTAQMDSLFYRLSKLVRRRRLEISFSVALLLTLMTATFLTAHQAKRAEASRIVAETEKDRSEEVVELLVGLFEVSDPALAKGSEITAREVLDQGSLSISRRLQDRPLLRAALTGTIGRVYRELADYEQANAHLKESLALRRKHLPADAQAVVESLHQLALLRLDELEIDEADVLLEQALQTESRARGNTTKLYGELLRARALCEFERGRHKKVDGLLAKALELSNLEEATTLDHAEIWDLGSRSAYLQGDFERASKLSIKSLAARRQILGQPHPAVATSLNNLAASLQAEGDADAARELLQEALDMRKSLYGDRHDAVALALHNLASSFLATGDADAARDLQEEALKIWQDLHGPQHPAIADVLHQLALIERRQGGRQAPDLHRRALEIRLTQLGPEHPETAQSYLRLGDSLRRQEPRRAEQAYREALELQRRYLDPTDHRTAYTWERLGSLLCPGSPKDGADYYREALRIRLESLGEDHWETARGRARLGRCLLASDKEAGIAELRAGFESLKSTLGENDPQTLKVEGWLLGALNPQHITNPRH